jgi:hypothetical protein
MKVADSAILAWQTEQKLNAQAASEAAPRCHAVPSDSQACAGAAPSGWNAGFGVRSADRIWLPPFNEVTQAWNAQLCQTQCAMGA